MVEAARYVGRDEAGGLLFDVDLSIPDGLTGDPSPTPTMYDALYDFFNVDLGELTAQQAHALLCCRDYGRQCAARLFDRHPQDVRDLFARLVAAFIMADDDRTVDVLAWARRRREVPRDGSAIAQTKRFGEVRAWIHALVGEANAAGAGIESPSYTKSHGRSPMCP